MDRSEAPCALLAHKATPGEAVSVTADGVVDDVNNEEIPF